MNTSLALPSPSYHAIIDRTDLQPSTKTKYKSAIDQLIAIGIDPRNSEALACYADTLSHSSRAFLKAALAIMFEETVTRLEASATPDNLAQVQSALLNIKAMGKAIKIRQPDTERTPHWLSQEQVGTVTSLALSRSTRDYIVLAVLLGAGLRREELEQLTFDALSQIPVGSKMCDVLTIRGKGDKKRIIPISSLLASHLRSWRETVGVGHIARSINKSGRTGESLSAFGIFSIVRKYGELIGVSDLDPHDLRRSYGRLMYEATHDIVLVKNYLGHSDTKTTLRYIGYDLKLDLPEEVFPIRDFVMTVAGD